MIAVIDMLRIYYHPCPQALGEYNYQADIIILHEGLKRYRNIHDAILRHEREHARIFKEHSSWVKRLLLNVRLDFEARAHSTLPLYEIAYIKHCTSSLISQYC